MAKYKIDFSKVKDVTLGEVFGTTALPVPEVNSIMKAYIEENELSDKPAKTPLQKFTTWWSEMEWADVTMDDYCKHAETVGIKKADKKRVAEIFTKFNNDVLDEDFQVVFDNFHTNLIKEIRKAENDK